MMKIAIPVEGVPILYRVNGDLVYLIDGIAFEDNQAIEVKYGLLQSDLGKYAARGQAAMIAHFFTLVADGLVLMRHIFEGLRRPLYYDGSLAGDKNKVAHSRKPGWDCEWKQGSKNEINRLHAPADEVFVVIISKNIKHAAKFPMVYGWIERWNWVKEDKSLPEAPVNWVERFDKRIYTRQ